MKFFQWNPQDSFSSVDATYIQFYTPETKEHSKQWVTSGGELVAKKDKTTASTRIATGTIFWDCEGIIIVHHLKKVNIIIRQWAVVRSQCKEL